MSIAGIKQRPRPSPSEKWKWNEAVPSGRQPVAAKLRRRRQLREWEMFRPISNHLLVSRRPRHLVGFRSNNSWWRPLPPSSNWLSRTCPGRDCWFVNRLVMLEGVPANKVLGRDTNSREEFLYLMLIGEREIISNFVRIHIYRCFALCLKRCINYVVYKTWKVAKSLSFED